MRHLDWCLALAEEHDPLSAGPRRSLRTLETEHDNLRAALAFALRRDPQAALRLATSLWRFWLDRGYFAEGNRWLEATLVGRARAHRRCASRRCWRAPGSSLRSGDAERVPAPRAVGAVADYRELGDEHATAAALYQHAMLEQSVSNTARADALFADAVALAPPARRPATAGGRHARVGDDAVVPLRHASRRARRCSEALALLEALPDDDTPVLRRRDLRAVPAATTGRRARPRLHLEETIFLFHRFARAQAIGYALNNLAWTARASGDIAAGRGRARRGAGALPRHRGPRAARR